VAEAAAAAPPAARIDLATAADLDALAALAEEVGVTGWSRASLASSLAGPDALAVAARDAAGALEGFGLARRAADELELLLVAVAPGARRRGLGRALVEGLLARAAGARAAHLEVRASNRAAIALYERAGFVATGRRKSYYGASEDALIMSRTR
jgi:ribosomal-protein-alanine N-acetyltransferase